MSFDRLLARIAVAFALLALTQSLGTRDGAILHAWDYLPVLALLLLIVATVALLAKSQPPLALGLLALLGGVVAIAALEGFTAAGAGYWCLLASVWFLAWAFAERLANRLAAASKSNWTGMLIPIAFGAAILLLWEAGIRGGNVPSVILPPPSAIWERITGNLPMLAADFQQTFLKAVLAGYVIGNAVGLGVAIAIDRSPFLKRGLLPIGNFVSALPLVGIAPIMVMWFGFDWPSKAAVVVIMTFFPMLVNAVAGLNVTVAMERDLMASYAASYWQTLFKLRLPAAAPFIFNALKINSTLALIGAIVAEFFGTPVVGMGFRISTAVGRMDIDLVWAEIAVSAVAGSVFYGVVALVERAVTFWHPSVRGGQG